VIFITVSARTFFLAATASTSVIVSELRRRDAECASFGLWFLLSPRLGYYCAVVVCFVWSTLSLLPEPVVEEPIEQLYQTDDTCPQQQTHVATEVTWKKSHVYHSNNE
jgi:hypothetical protein